MHTRQRIVFEKYTKLREIIDRIWNEKLSRYPNTELDEFVIMPNDLHGIIIIGAGARSGASARLAPTLGEIIGEFKLLCVNDWLEYIKKNKIDAIGKFWQRNYYEHIVRNEEELNNIRIYIVNNPLNWEFDGDNPLCLRNMDIYNTNNFKNDNKKWLYP